jgi:hypothetical protein
VLAVSHGKASAWLPVLELLRKYEGALVRNGVVKVTRSLSQLRLPSTVQGILAARIDRLSAERTVRPVRARCD